MQISNLAKDGVAAVRGLLQASQEHASGDRAETQNMDALELLKSQHREVEGLFHAIETASDRAAKAKERLVREVEAKLSRHMRLEEKVFYPTVKGFDEATALEAYEEHEAMKSALRRLAQASPKDEDFKAKVTVLKEITMHHVRDEEQDLFPKVRSELSDGAFARLTKQLQRALERAEGRAEQEEEEEETTGQARRASARKAAQTRRRGNKAAPKKTSSRAAKAGGRKRSEDGRKAKKTTKKQQRR